MTRLLYLWAIPIFCALFSCNSPDNAPVTSLDFIKAGDSLSARTFDTLTKTMNAALKAGNYEKAILVCKQMAPGLTGTYNNHAAKIRRTSNKYRNKANAPDYLEKPQLDFFQKLSENGMPMKSKLVVDEKGTVHYFKPIILQPICLNCHGKQGEDIAANTLAILKAQYPEDSASGYKAGELRGLWHITFNPFTKKSN